MFNKLSALPLIALLCASACGGGNDDSAVPSLRPVDAASTSDGKASVSDKTETGASVTTTESRAATIDREFADLVTQSAPWGDLEVSVIGARLYRGERPDDLPKDSKFSEDTVYAVLDVKIEAGDNETDYRDRDTWDLILTDGMRVPPVNPLNVLLEPGDAPTVSIYYEVEEDSDFRGAELELNGAEREKFEPLRIPLGIEGEFESQAKLPGLVGQTFEPVEDGELSFEVLDAVYGVNLIASGRRAPRDQRLVALTVRVGYEGNFSHSFSTDDEGPRLSYNGSSHVSDDNQIDTIEGGESQEFTLVYSVDENVDELDVVFNTGDPDLDRVQVDLPSLLPKGVSVGASAPSFGDDEPGDDEQSFADDSDFGDDELGDDESSFDDDSDLGGDSDFGDEQTFDDSQSESSFDEDSSSFTDDESGDDDSEEFERN
jgi:hypothetical protein